VDDYVAASGLTPQEAFGDASVYARSLKLPRDPSQSSGNIVQAILPILAMTAALWVTWTTVFAAVKHQATTTIPWTLPLVLVLMLALVWLAAPMIRWASRSWGGAGVLGVCWVAIIVGIGWAGRWGLPVPTASAWVATGVLWAIGIVWWLAGQLRNSDADARATLIAQPIGDQTANLKSQKRWTRGAVIATPIVILVIAAIGSALMYWLT